MVSVRDAQSQTNAPNDRKKNHRWDFGIFSAKASNTCSKAALLIICVLLIALLPCWLTGIGIAPFTPRPSPYPSSCCCFGVGTFITTGSTTAHTSAFAPVCCCVVLCCARAARNDGTENCPTCTYLLGLDPQNKAICLFVRACVCWKERRCCSRSY